MTHLATGEAVRVQGIAVTYGDHPVLRQVGFDVLEGAFTGLIGPNGAGKTTLLRVVARLLAADHGVVELDGDDVTRLPRRQLARRLALVEQRASTEVELSVRDVALLGRIPHGGAWHGPTATDHAIADHHLERLGLAELADRPWHTLSGGEQQRAQLARAFAQEPRVLALDEPTNHLDIAHALQLLAAVRHAGITVVAALHDLNLAATFCDQLVALDGGEVVAVGTPAEVITPTLLREVYGVDADVALVDGRPAITYRPPAVPHGPPPRLPS